MVDGGVVWCGAVWWWGEGGIALEAEREPRLELRESEGEKRKEKARAFLPSLSLLLAGCARRCSKDGGWGGERARKTGGQAYHVTCQYLAQRPLLQRLFLPLCLLSDFLSFFLSFAVQMCSRLGKRAIMRRKETANVKSNQGELQEPLQ